MMLVLMLVFLLVPSFDVIRSTFGRLQGKNIADSSLLNGDGEVALVIDGYAAIFFLDA